MDSTEYGGVLVQGLTLEKLLRVLTDGSHKPVDLYVSDTLYVDHLLEYTADHGVDVDGLSLKDRRIYHGSLDNSLTSLAGGNGPFTGGNVLVYGSTHATNANDILLRAGAVTKLQWDNSAGKWIFADGVSIEIDHINEAAAGHGVLIDGLNLQDGAVGGPTHDIGTTTGNTTVDWDDGHVQTVKLGGAHNLTVGAAGSHNKAGGRYFLYVDSNGQNPGWVGVSWGDGNEPTWSDNHLVMFVSPDAGDTVLGYDMGGGYTVAIPA